MADLHIKVGGAWKAIDAASVKVGGAWKDVQNIYCKVGGAWKTVWNAVVYNLTGTSGSPTARAYTATDPANARVTWSITGATGAFGTVKGYMQQDGYDEGDAITYGSSHAFVTPLSGWGALYFRLTYEAGSDTALTASHAIDGSTWHTLTEDSTNIFWSTGVDTIAASPVITTIKVEMATDSGGTNIVATGYYRATTTVQSGA